MEEKREGGREGRKSEEMWWRERRRDGKRERERVI